MKPLWTASVLALIVIAAQAQAQTVSDYLARIAAIDDAGPRLNAVLAINPDAVKEEAAARKIRAPLAGKAMLIKDNIEVAGPMPTTAGSLALQSNVTGRDAPLVAGLRKAGVVILGKTNLSEWANIRSTSSSSGWSAVGGQTKNPHAIDRSPCGSSSGSGAAVAAGLAWAAIGTETNGSISCPASANGIVGFKPTVGMVSRTHVVPISHSQDTAGPMTRSVADAALIMNAIAGTDPADPATAEAGKRKSDFTAGLATASLKGLRLGVMRKQAGGHPVLLTLFEKALADLKTAGAELVDIQFEPAPEAGMEEYGVLLFELREDMGAYLRSLPGADSPRSLADLMAFNKAHPEELRWFGQDIFELAETTTDKAAYEAARASSLKRAGADGIDRLLRENDVSLLIAPTDGPAWPIDPVLGDHFSSVGAGGLAAVAGYPHLTVPMGAVEGLPIGLSFIGAKWEDKHVLDAGAAYERARTTTVPVPGFKRWGE